MNNAGLNHADRFEEMKRDVDSRMVQWFFTLPSENKSRQMTMFKGLTEATLPMGLFENNYFDTECMGIPRIGKRNKGRHDDEYDMTLAFVATNAPATVISRCVWDMSDQHENLDIIGVCIQLAKNNNDELVVVSSQAFTIRYGSAYYEYPPGYRLVMAMNDQVYPEWSVSLFRCSPDHSPNWSVTHRNECITNLYQQRIIDEIPDDEFEKQILNQWAAHEIDSIKQQSQ